MNRILSERRKADRAEMAKGLVAVAIAAGAAAEIEEMGPGEVWIQIAAARGLRLTIILDRESPQPDVHVLSWFMASDVDTRFADAFTRAGRVSLNTVHFSKATDVAHGYQDLCIALRDGLDLARSGQAFDAAREATAIAANGTTAAERIAAFQVDQTVGIEP